MCRIWQTQIIRQHSFIEISLSYRELEQKMEQIKKELSVGTIITDGQYILGCRPYGRKDKEHSYDLPKGHWEEGETYVETAVRECKEETDFDLWPDHLVDLGKYEYIPTKDLYIFLVALDLMPELKTLKCTTFFEMDGKKVPEVISYKLIPITELQWFFKSLEPIVKEALEIFDSNIEEDEEAIVALLEPEPEAPV
jgi:8-oxo-dGTP pyrophosphatase MutT (NUDIX family)